MLYHGNRLKAICSHLPTLLRWNWKSKKTAKVFYNIKKNWYIKIFNILIWLKPVTSTIAMFKRFCVFEYYRNIKGKFIILHEAVETTNSGHIKEPYRVYHSCFPEPSCFFVAHPMIGYGPIKFKIYYCGVTKHVIPWPRILTNNDQNQQLSYYILHQRHTNGL